MATKFLKSSFSLMAGPLPPPPPLLMARPLREELFLRLPLGERKIFKGRGVGVGLNRHLECQEMSKAFLKSGNVKLWNGLK